jgi:hypothetical protein
MRQTTKIPEDRDLSPQEASLVKWMLEHGDKSAIEYLPQLDTARVASRCSCGCGSINFAISDVIPPDGNVGILADFEYVSVKGNLCGAFVFERFGTLAGLELWSIDGKEIPADLPATGALQRLRD